MHRRPLFVAYRALAIPGEPPSACLTHVAGFCISSLNSVLSVLLMFHLCVTHTHTSPPALFQPVSSLSMLPLLLAAWSWKLLLINT
jgi:hypothetical protein